MVYSRIRENDGTYDDEYIAQIMLKGIGSCGYNGGGNVLASRISGFHDNFVTGIL